MPSSRKAGEQPFPTLGLAPGGVYQADRVTPIAGALLPHRFTLTCVDRSPPSAVCSLLHCPASHLDWPLASTLLCGVPTFLNTVPQVRPVLRPPSRLTVALSLPLLLAEVVSGRAERQPLPPKCPARPHR